MIEVYETKKIQENCSTCLYQMAFGCGNANRKEDWFKYAMFGYGCPSYWLDHNRFTPKD